MSRTIIRFLVALSIAGLVLVAAPCSSQATPKTPHVGIPACQEFPVVIYGAQVTEIPATVREFTTEITKLIISPDIANRNYAYRRFREVVEHITLGANALDFFPYIFCGNVGNQVLLALLKDGFEETKQPAHLIGHTYLLARYMLDTLAMLNVRGFKKAAAPYFEQVWQSNDELALIQMAKIWLRAQDVAADNPGVKMGQKPAEATPAKPHPDLQAKMDELRAKIGDRLGSMYLVRKALLVFGNVLREVCCFGPGYREMDRADRKQPPLTKQEEAEEDFFFGVERVEMPEHLRRLIT